MNDELFGLPLAPFSAVPDVNLFVETPGACEAIHLLIRSLLRDDGIAVLTGDVGVGKTMISKVLADRLSHKLRPLVLSSANFPTRRALYQSVLFSLGQDFVGLTEQEARLLVLESSREQLSKRGNLVLIIDEAHLLTDRLLEELRSLISNVDEGRLLVQIVLIGHTSLKDRLRDPRFVNLQHRIGCFAQINPMSVDESTDYIRWRLELAGRDAFDVVTPGALRLITEVANGYPRCINILCDRAIGLAVESSSPIVDESLVRLALTELRQLPLVWNEPAGGEVCNTAECAVLPQPAGFETPVPDVPALRLMDLEAVDPAVNIADAPSALAIDLSPSEEWAAFEIGADWPSESVATAPASIVSRQTTASIAGQTAGEFEEIPVFDPYAQFDALLEAEPPAIVKIAAAPFAKKEQPIVVDRIAVEQATVRPPAIVDLDEMVDDLEDEAPDARWIEEFVEESWPEISVLEAIHELRAGIQEADVKDDLLDDVDLESLDSTPLEQPSPPPVLRGVSFGDIDDVEYDIVEPEPPQAVATEDSFAEPVAVMEPAVPPVQEASQAESFSLPATEPIEAAPIDFLESPSLAELAEPTNRFAGLFTRLRRKRQAVVEESRFDR